MSVKIVKSFRRDCISTRETTLREENVIYTMGIVSCINIVVEFPLSWNETLRIVLQPYIWVHCFSMLLCFQQFQIKKNSSSIFMFLSIVGVQMSAPLKLLYTILLWWSEWFHVEGGRLYCRGTQSFSDSYTFDCCCFFQSFYYVMRRRWIVCLPS